MYEIIRIQFRYPFIFQVTITFMRAHTITSVIWIIFHFDFVERFKLVSGQC